MLPKWYPNIVHPADGNFIEKHIHSIAEDIKVVVLFVKGVNALQKTDIERASHHNLTTVVRYFKRNRSILSFIIFK